GQFPGTIDGGPANRYSAGTFEFASAAYTGLIETDLEAAMKGTNATAYTRIELDSPDPAEFSSLTLRMRYDDGFVAYLNGTEVARRNAPQNVFWNSTATSARPLEDSLEVESINITEHLPALREGHNVLAIVGLNVAADDDDFLIRPELVAAGLPGEGLVYFDTPTPGAPNNSESTFTGFINKVRFSVERGFFDAPFELELSTSTEGAEIRYTTDGSPPTAGTGTVYRGPITIDSLTTLRAAAFKDTLRPSDVITQSYLFLDDVLSQPANPAGYPSFDFAMDQNASHLRQIVDDSNATTQEVNETIKNSLLSLPTMSITMSVDDFFGPGGIYRNPQQRGLEKPASIEYILPDGSEGFQINAALRIMGGTSRNSSVNVKHSLRILFKKEYGKGRLNYQFFPDSPVDNFNTIALRANARDSWSGDATWAQSNAFYIRDQWAKVAQRDMGAPATAGNFIHLYINGMYWGVYNPTERPDAAFAEQHFGGEDSDYDAVKFCCGQRAVDGDLTKWNELLGRANAGVGSDTAYQRLLGNNADGTRNPDTEVLLDVDNLIDYIIAGQYHAAADWPGNYYVSRLRGPDSTGFRFFTWDNDLAFVRNGVISVNADKTRSDFNGWWTESPGVLDIALRANAEYRLRFADRAHTQYFNGGSLTPEVNAQRWIDIAETVREALVAESVRWGDNRGTLYTPSHWEAVN
ncbi:MAG: CotH kinase family protein, partial [Planctomycetes bacterium]|nr:CotH kinase family protein [Planctomycetota bacterium]